MAADYGKKTQSDNKHLSNLTSARFQEIDGSSANINVRTTKPGRVIRVIIWQKGLAFTVNNGSRIVASVGTGTPENSYDVGVYCENGIRIAGVSGSGFATLVYDE